MAGERKAVVLNVRSRGSSFTPVSQRVRRFETERERQRTRVEDEVRVRAVTHRTYR